MANSILPNIDVNHPPRSQREGGDHNLKGGPRVSIFCQDPNKLIRELAAAIGRGMGHCTMIAGKTVYPEEMVIPNVSYLVAAGYRRGSIVQRALSWAIYTLQACWRAFTVVRQTDVFLFVSSPPFIGLLGYLVNVLTGKPYVVLVNDVYPHIAENFGVIRQNGLAAKCWRALNYIIYNFADQVITLGEEMSKLIAAQMKSEAGSTRKVVVIPTWVDTEIIKPIPKKDNPFARRYDQGDKITVMYAGNFGNVSGVDLLPKMAKKFEKDERLSFLMVGKGEKLDNITKMIHKLRNKNISLLPYQRESVLPTMLATADISLVALDPRAQGMSIPSKTYYYMAAGSAILAYCAPGDALQGIVEKYKCGLPVKTDAEAARAIIFFKENAEFLEQCKINSRKAAELFYDQKHCIAMFLDVLRESAVRIKAVRNANPPG